MAKSPQAYRFRITLREVAPPIWREIEVPTTYSLWDLHVAIQDAMGWRDYHLHVFKFRQPDSDDVVEVGIPDPELPPGADSVLPGWKPPRLGVLSRVRSGGRVRLRFR